MGQTSSKPKCADHWALTGCRCLSCLVAVGLTFSTTLAQDVVPKPRPATEEGENLLKEFPKGWLRYSSDAETPLSTTWQITRETDAQKEFVLICLGKPDGYIRTEKEYENFELGIEWKYPTDPNGNSGILLYTIEKDMIWPKSVQVQLHRPTAGSVFPSNGAKVDHPVQSKDLSKPINEWNDCVITSIDGRISVTMNGHKVGDVTGCMPQKGCIGLQSEGSEIHFRKLWIKPLGAAEKRVSGRKLSIRYKRMPVCPPEMTMSQLPDEVLVLTPAEAHRAKLEAQRISRALRRYELTGRIKPSTFRNLSPYATFAAPWPAASPPPTAP